MNIEEAVEYLKNCLDDKYNFKNATRKKDKEATETLLTAYEKGKEKKEELIKERAKEIIYVDRNFIRKDKIKPIQIIDLDGKIHNVYKIEEE